MLDSTTCVSAVVEEDGLWRQRMVTKRYKRDLKELEARRRKGMQMLARGIAQAEVARQLGVSRQAVSTWAAASAGNDQAWRRKPLGRPAVLSASQKKRLGKLLEAGVVTGGLSSEPWTLARIDQLIQREFGVAFSASNVWLILKSLGYSSQHPIGRAIQTDETVVLE